MSVYTFPKGFLWGTASSAYQTEGNNKNCNWYFEEQADMSKPYAARRLMEQCGLACDHWNRYKDDFSCAEEIGIKIHRVSIEWSRVCPGENCTDRASLEHYREMLLDLRARGIKVMLCIHHFTIPHWVSAKGGFENKAFITEHFRKYAELIVMELGELVDYWIPINEPNMLAITGYLMGKFPPFKKSPLKYFKVLKTVLQMHIDAYDIIKSRYPEKPVGVAFAFQHFQPYSKRSPVDRFSAKMANRFMNLCCIEGINDGHLRILSRKRGKTGNSNEKLDFMGINYYNTNFIKGMSPVKAIDGAVITDMGWICDPKGLDDALQYVHDYFNIPIIVTENGIATNDEALRIKYVNDHLEVIGRAIKRGIDVRGYMYWSLTDNYEWEKGFSMHFGLVRIDYETQKRAIKDGGKWFANVIKSNSIQFQDVKATGL
jgi:beta-glucosidase